MSVNTRIETTCSNCFLRLLAQYQKKWRDPKAKTKALLEEKRDQILEIIRS